MYHEEKDDLDHDDELDDGSRYGFDVSSPHVSKGHSPVHSTPAEHIDAHYDAGRYDSARGWEPKDKYKKARDAYRKNHPEEFCRDSMFETRSAGKWLSSGEAINKQTNLFGSLWRTGELAVLFAESGAGSYGRYLKGE